MLSLPLFRELDELEREDFTRLKKVQANKAIAAAAEKQEKLAAEAAAKAAAPSPGQGLSFTPAKELAISSAKTEVAQDPLPSQQSESLLSGYDAADDDDVVFK